VDYQRASLVPPGEKGIGQRLKALTVVCALCLSARMKLPIFAIISERICDDPASITSESLDLSLPFQWNALEGSFIADAISRTLRKGRSIVSILYIRKRTSGRGILW
jgi:hypothetical protein